MCCLSFSLESSTSWLNKLQMSPTLIGGKAWTEGTMSGNGHSYHRADGLNDFGVGVCHFTINLVGACLSDNNLSFIKDIV